MHSTTMNFFSLREEAVLTLMRQTMGLEYVMGIITGEESALVAIMPEEDVMVPTIAEVPAVLVVAVEAMVEMEETAVFNLSSGIMCNA